MREPKGDEAKSDEAKCDNLNLWDAWTKLHQSSAYYDVEGVINGRDPLQPFEPTEIGLVAGKTMLHLQSHLGLDSIAWARRGATVEGIDFSARAVEAATSLAIRCGVNERTHFIQGSVTELERVIDRRYDIVYTSWGTYSWLNDLEPWAAGIAAALEPNGIFYMADVHPIGLAVSSEDGRLVPSYPYGGARRVSYDARSYADRTFPALPAHNWSHGLGEIVTALAEVGLTIELLRERIDVPWRLFPDMLESDEGRYRVDTSDLPLSFSLRARRPA